jgi:WD40 repeat protein
VLRIAFSSDGRHILTASRDTTARLWDVSGKQLAIFSHTGRVVQAVFSPKGDQVLTASADTTARLWDLTGKQLVSFKGYSETFMESAVFSPNQGRLLIASADNTVRQHLVDVKDVLAVAACRVGRGLTADEITSFEVDTPHFVFTERRCPPDMR